MSKPLAIHGAEPVFPAGPPIWPLPDESVQAALSAVYESGDWGRYQGSQNGLLIEALCELCGSRFAWPCCSGTLGVELALKGLKIGEGDEVILSAYDFSGNFRSIEAAGAKPVLVDIDPTNWCLNASQLTTAVGEKTKAILVSHLHGGLANMQAILEFARQHGLLVVEDVCQNPGAICQGKPAGNWGDAAVFSFGGSKLLTAGRGGAVVTSQEEIYQRIKIYAERGNNAFALSELQAAVLLPQFKKLAQRNQLRHSNVQQLLSLLGSIPGLQTLPMKESQGFPSYYKVPFLLEPPLANAVDRKTMIAALQAEGLAMDAGFRGFVRRPEAICRKPAKLTCAQTAAEQTMLLHHPILLEPAETMQRVAAALEKVARHFLNNAP